MEQKYRQLPKLSDANVERFYSKIDVRGIDECWLWIAACDESGRGMIRFDGRLYKAPRVAYFLANGIDPKRRDVCHSCDTPACCNPKHLWLGTRAANNKDRDAKGHQIAHPGEKHGCAILTEGEVREILESPHTGVCLATHYGVSEATISAIRHRRLWKHLHA